jgi:serine/threonine protein kinase
MGWNDLIGMQLDQYEILSELGRGGSSRVYQARDTNLNRDVAIKVIPNDADDRALFLDRFHREVEAVQKLHNANIVGVFGAGVNDEFVYLVMQCVTGGTLRRQLSGPLPVPEATSYVVQIAYALQHAHEKHIIHRDVKPSNMLLEYQGSNHVLLTDFGIAKIQGARGLTKSGTTIGTPEYMSPEQAEGRDIDERSDIYALGCVLYETLAGRPPFRGSTALSVLFQQVHSRPAYIRGFNPTVPADLVRALEIALSKRPDERFESAAEFADALLPFAANLPTVQQQTMDHGPIVITQSQGLTPSRPLTKEQRQLANDLADRDTVQNPYVPTQADAMEEETAPLPAFSARKTMPPFSRIFRTTPPAHRRKTHPPSFSRQTHDATPPSRTRKTQPPLVRVRRASALSGLNIVVHAPDADLPATADAEQTPPFAQSGVGREFRGPSNLPQRTLRSAVSGPMRPGTDDGGNDGGNDRRRARATSGGNRGGARGRHVPDSRIPATWPRARKPRRWLAVMAAAVIVLVAFGWLALNASGFALPFGAKTSATGTANGNPTAAHTATTAATATAASTQTAGPQPTATTSPQQVLNQQASKSFRGVTLATFGDGTCSGANARSSFASGQTIYVNLCTSGNAVSAPMTVAIRHNGQVVYTMAYGRFISPSSTYFYYTTHVFSPGSYDVLVTLALKGGTGVARDLSLSIY